MSELLSLQQVSYWYKQGSKQQFILKNVDITFERSTFYTIVGPSGSGKTTFLALISALDIPGSGKILYEGTDLSKIGLTRFRNQYVSIVFQSYNLLPYMTAIQNVITGMEITGVKHQNKKQYAFDLLKRVGITKEQAHQKVLTLSGGQQQRVSIARAISTPANLIVADEPTGNLDEETAKSIITLLQKLAHEEGKCVIVVTHDQSIASNSDVKITLTKEKMVKERLKEVIVK
ncbi:ABC transporter ATP-binding protein [Jeotgalibacillus sp. S-D1]|uniref:ABC transporter ATP-binding protein n=1 Tax=Jeotgalibacillus sp. S-D1 TaxID=2552189 RepID=UPI0010594C51|nr:ABC transporter ATP-binding protein [Jeotgalibacillus sp. S-D1]TDL31952.1 ABC transporter ATP-binding protein [Jeotgalibacillus sp. S-D1]